MSLFMIALMPLLPLVPHLPQDVFPVPHKRELKVEEISPCKNPKLVYSSLICLGPL